MTFRGCVMKELARAIGYLSLASGVMLLSFPDASKRLMKVRSEYAQLSPGALRLLGVWELLTGILLVGVTTSPAVGARLGEVLSPERRRAA